MFVPLFETDHIDFFISLLSDNVKSLEEIKVIAVDESDKELFTFCKIFGKLEQYLL
jgi:hypothetical protein